MNIKFNSNLTNIKNRRSGKTAPTYGQIYGGDDSNCPCCAMNDVNYINDPGCPCVYYCVDC